jgi:hypothetical protein
MNKQVNPHAWVSVWLLENGASGVADLNEGGDWECPGPAFILGRF